MSFAVFGIQIMSFIHVMDGLLLVGLCSGMFKGGYPGDDQKSPRRTPPRHANEATIRYSIAVE